MHFPYFWNMRKGKAYCWHCGEREIYGHYICPYCGANYDHPEKAVVKKTVKPKTSLGAWHPSVLRAQLKYLIYSVLFGLGWCVIVMYWAAQVIDWRVYAIIWAFWFIWLTWHTINTARSVSASRKENKKLGETVTCGCCGCKSHVLANYCFRCGSIILKPSTEEYLTVDPNMDVSAGVYSQKTMKNIRRSNRKANRQSYIILIVLFIVIVGSIYYLARQ